MESASESSGFNLDSGSAISIGNSLKGQEPENNTGVSLDSEASTSCRAGTTRNL